MALSAVQFLAGSDLDGGENLFAAGTRSGDGLIYFPEAWASSNGKILVVDPSDDSSSLSIFGGSGFGTWSLGHGHYFAAADVIVYTLNQGYASTTTKLYIIGCTTNIAVMADITGTDVSTAASSSVLHSNGYLYTFRPANVIGLLGGGTLITKIDTVSFSLAATSVHASLVDYSENFWHPAGATEGVDGRIYCVQGQYHHDAVPGSDAFSAPHILIYDPADDSWEYSNLGMGWLPVDQMYAEGVPMPDGTLVYLPALADQSDPLYPALIIDSNTGSASVASTELPGIAWQQGNDPYQRAFRGADNRIYYTGQIIGNPDYAELVAYNPSTDSYDTWVPAVGGSRGIPSYMLGVSDAGVIYGAPGYSIYGDGDVIGSKARITDWLMKVIPSTTGTGWSFAVGSTPVNLALGANPVSGTVG